MPSSVALRYRHRRRGGPRGSNRELFIWPTTDDIRPVDAVVLFTGGRGERLELAERLMNENTAANLVIPNGAPEWRDGNAAWTEPPPYEVHCLDPDPDTTRAAVGVDVTVVLGLVLGRGDVANAAVGPLALC